MPTGCLNNKGEPVECVGSSPVNWSQGTITYNAGGIPGNTVYNPPPDVITALPPPNAWDTVPLTNTAATEKDNTFLYLIAGLILIILFGSNS